MRRIAAINDQKVLHRLLLNVTFKHIFQTSRYVEDEKVYTKLELIKFSHYLRGIKRCCFTVIRRTVFDYSSKFEWQRAKHEMGAFRIERENKTTWFDFFLHILHKLTSMSPSLHVEVLNRAEWIYLVISAESTFCRWPFAYDATRHQFDFLPVQTNTKKRNRKKHVWTWWGSRLLDT